jgi:hypothetical protein
MRNSTDRESQEIKERFVQFATDLCAQFPGLDLRFNLRHGTNWCRVFTGPYSRRRYLEVDLATPELDLTLYEAVWEIKRAEGILDA